MPSPYGTYHQWALFEGSSTVLSEASVCTPSSQPSSQPSSVPSGQPSSQPSSSPSARPSRGYLRSLDLDSAAEYWYGVFYSGSAC
ncbi:MAG: hypothetical protein EOO69_13670, partial [Moraxellaceae bacterium]